MRKNKAVTAVIGVMLMVAITVAIAATFYVWVHGFQPKPEPHFQGWIYNAYDTQPVSYTHLTLPTTPYV